MSENCGQGISCSVSGFVWATKPPHAISIRTNGHATAHTTCHALRSLKEYSFPYSDPASEREGSGYTLTRLQTHPAPLPASVPRGAHSAAGSRQHSLAEEGAILERLPEVGGVAGRVDTLAGDLGDPLERLRRQLRAVLAQDLPEKRAARQYSHAQMPSHSQATIYVTSRQVTERESRKSPIP